MTKKKSKKVYNKMPEGIKLGIIFVITLFLIIVVFSTVKFKDYSCSSPYTIFNKYFCCIDKDDNGVCDFSERLINVNCENKCDESKCEDFNFIQCYNTSFGCTKFIDLGILKGECGVQCLNTNECNSSSVCEDYICKREELRCRQYCELGIEIVEQKFENEQLFFTIKNNNINKSKVSCITFVQSKIMRDHPLHIVSPGSTKQFKLTVPEDDVVHLVCTQIDRLQNAIGEQQIFLYNTFIK